MLNDKDFSYQSTCPVVLYTPCDTEKLPDWFPRNFKVTGVAEKAMSRPFMATGKLYRIEIGDLTIIQEKFETKVRKNQNKLQGRHCSGKGHLFLCGMNPRCSANIPRWEIPDGLMGNGHLLYTIF